MLTEMTTMPDVMLPFMGLAASLAVALMWMLHELEPKLARLHLKRDRVSRDRIR